MASRGFIVNPASNLTGIRGYGLLLSGLLLALLLLPGLLRADVVKPTMVDIEVHSDGHVLVELHVSIEALLTGINNRWRKTQDAPQAKEYDGLRALQAPQLAERFEPFEREMLDGMVLAFDGERIGLSITKVEIPEPGYQKVPRSSVLFLQGQVPRGAKELTWYFPQRFSDNAVRVKQVNVAESQWRWSDWVWIRDDSASDPFPIEEAFVKKPMLDVVLNYIAIGYDHIVPIGLDHILFVVGIFLLTVRFRPLLSQVTMFTLAHSITLALGVYGIWELSPRIVEPLIALSIVYVGVENLFARDVHRRRLVLVFCFGLLHGMGFAGALKEFGMPPGDYATALISFNIGVELGQIAIIATAFVVLFGWLSGRAWYRLAVVLPVSAIISIVGMVWTVDRLSI